MTTHASSRSLPPIARALPIGAGWFKPLIAAWESYRRARADRGVEDLFHREREARARFLARARDHFHRERLERAWDCPSVDFRRRFY